MLRSLFVVLCAVSFARSSCPRQPSVGHSRASKSPGDRGFHLSITDNPDRYVPGTVYTVTLSGTDGGRFVRFILTAESKDDGNESPQASGTFQLFGDILTTFNEQCVNTISETNDAPKALVEVMWTAPPAGSGCVVLRAMVVQDRYHWYADDGKLSLEICEQSDKDTVSEQCCACDEAKYNFVFEGLWSNVTHPKDFPTSLWLTHFSDIVGASHERGWKFWGDGQIATDGFRSLAEWGSAHALDAELRVASPHLRSIIRAGGLWYPKVNTNTTAHFRVDRKRPQVSLVSMFGPSPDWVVGVSQLDLCLRNCTWLENKVIDLYPWDSGTDSGITYMSPNAETVPRERMYRITTSYPEDPRAPFYDPRREEMEPLARLYITLNKVVPKSCSDDFLSAQVEISENTEDVNRPECEVTSWSDWSSCSVTCGKGLRMHQRAYLRPEKAEMMQCDRQLVGKEMCVADVPECEGGDAASEEEELPDLNALGICNLSSWSPWSPCSESCGKGVRMRTRTFLDPMGSKKCPHATLVEKDMCVTSVECGPEKPPVPGCPVTPWSEWSACSASCGPGVMMRMKLLLSPPEKKEECTAQVELVQQRECNYGACRPLGMEAAKDICMQEPDQGPCRGSYNRWYFEPKKLMCVPFIYGGCRGNKNNFLTADECNDVCQIIRNSVNGFGGQFNTVNEPPVDCELSPWSAWTPCSVTCGRGGFSTRERHIIAQPLGGGRQCPKRLTRRRRCNRPPCN